MLPLASHLHQPFTASCAFLIPSPPICRLFSLRKAAHGAAHKKALEDLREMTEQRLHKCAARGPSQTDLSPI